MVLIELGPGVAAEAVEGRGQIVKGGAGQFLDGLAGGFLGLLELGFSGAWAFCKKYGIVHRDVPVTCIKLVVGNHDAVVK